MIDQDKMRALAKHLREDFNVWTHGFVADWTTSAGPAANAIDLLLAELEASDQKHKEAILDAEKARDERNRAHVKLNAEWIEKTNALRAELEAAAADKRPAVVLTYSTQGHRKPCGQTIGANGCGEFVILYYGDIDSAESQARTHILNMQGASYQFDWVSIIRSDDEAYYGPVMTSIEVAALAQRQEGS